MARLFSKLPLVLAAAAVAALGCPGSSPPAPQQAEEPPPRITSVDPEVAALGFPFLLRITGPYLGGPAESEEAAPTLTIFRTRDLDGNPVSGPEGSDLVPVEAVGTVQVISVWVDLPTSVPSGVFGFRVTTRSGRTASFPEALVLLDAPAFSGAAPDAVCVASDAAVSLSGELAVIDGAGPVVRLTNGRQSWDPGAIETFVAASPAECAPVTFARADVRRCARLDVPVPAMTASGAVGVWVTIPSMPWGPLLATSIYADYPMALPPSPHFGAVVVADAPWDLAITPVPKVYAPGGVPPAATVDGAAAACAVSGCVASGVPGIAACDGLTVTLPQGLAPGLHPISVTTTPGCVGATSAQVIGRPTITGLDPPFLCARSLWIRVLGANLVAPTATVGDAELYVYDAGACDFPTCTGSEPCLFRTCDSIVVARPWFSMAPGTYSLTIVNSTTPRIAPTVPVVVAPGPPAIVGGAPGTIYGGIAHTFAIDLAEDVTTITAVTLTAGAARIALDFQPSPGRVTVSVPAGLPAGNDALELTEAGLCTASSPLVVWDSYVVSSSTFDGGAGGVWIGGPTPPPPPSDVAWHETGGNPGGAVSFGTTGGGSPWYFTILPILPGGLDYASVRFDLRRAAGGTDLEAPDVILHDRISERRLERAFPAPPDGSWSTFEVPLDDAAGWAFRDAGGTRPATRADLWAMIETVPDLWIRGQYGSDANETWLDNVVSELHH